MPADTDIIVQLSLHAQKESFIEILLILKTDTTYFIQSTLFIISIFPNDMNTWALSSSSHYVPNMVNNIVTYPQKKNQGPQKGSTNYFVMVIVLRLISLPNKPLSW